MKLTANSVIHSECIGRPNFTHKEALEMLMKAGYDGMDVNLAGMINADNYLHDDDWKEKISELKETADRLGAEISQSHLPFYNFADPAITDLDMKNEMFKRAITASGMLNVKWAVFHAGNAIDSVKGRSESKRRTIEFIRPYMELAATLGVGIAIENLFIPTRLTKAHRYCSNVEDVCDLVDTLGENTGVCWDFGHANLVGDDQADCLRLVGKRLKCLHVHDNNGKHDDHLLPFSNYSTVNWRAILPTLDEIGYEGNFNFELINTGVPVECREKYLEYTNSLGRGMIALIKQKEGK